MVDTLSSPDNTGRIGQASREVKGGLLEEPDVLSGAELYLEHGDQNEIAKELKRKRDKDGNLIGWKHSNPVLDSHIFVIELSEGDQHVIGYNILADSLYSQMTQKENS